MRVGVLARAVLSVPKVRLSTRGRTLGRWVCTGGQTPEASRLVAGPCAESQRGRERFSPQEFDPQGNARHDKGTDQLTFPVSHPNSDRATPPRCAKKARGPGASPRQGLSLSHAALYKRGLRALLR